MKVANDLFLMLISDLLTKLHEDNLSNKVKKAIHHEITIKKEFKEDFDLYKMIKSYLLSNKNLKNYLQKVTEKIAEASSDEDRESVSEKISKNKVRNYKNLE